MINICQLHIQLQVRLDMNWLIKRQQAGPHMGGTSSKLSDKLHFSRT